MRLRSQCAKKHESETTLAHTDVLSPRLALPANQHLRQRVPILKGCMRHYLDRASRPDLRRSARSARRNHGVARRAEPERVTHAWRVAAAQAAGDRSLAHRPSPHCNTYNTQHHQQFVAVSSASSQH